MLTSERRAGAERGESRVEEGPNGMLARIIVIANQVRATGAHSHDTMRHGLERVLADLRARDVDEASLASLRAYMASLF